MHLPLIAILAALLAGAYGQAEEACDPVCGINAECNSGACACPSDYLGDPHFYCYAPTYDTCFAFGDPKLHAFSGDSTRLKIPCKVTMAQFDTPLDGFYTPGVVSSVSAGPFSTTDPAENNCRVVVQSVTKMSIGGQYYTHSVELRLVININNNPQNIWVTLESGSTNYMLNGGGNYFIRDGECPDVSVNGKTVTICNFDTMKMWSVTSDDCGGLEVVFRPWDTNVENQPNTVGMGIITKTRGNFEDPRSWFPSSMCHEPPPYGLDTVYKDYYKAEGIDSRYGSTIYAFLSNPPQEEQNDVDCTNVITTFQNCPRESKIDAVNTCATILLEYASCALANAQRPLQAFENCLKGFCGKEKAQCAIARDQIDNKICKEPPNFNC